NFLPSPGVRRVYDSSGDIQCLWSDGVTIGSSSIQRSITPLLLRKESFGQQSINPSSTICTWQKQSRKSGDQSQSTT
ncbi:MAG: hypothetical protein AAB209_07075, partial [Bacteroidota bacterium]